MSRAYRSGLAAYLSGLVEAKRAVGYPYESAEHYLHQFDRYCMAHAQGSSLTRELVLGWARAKDGEAPATHRTRLSPIRALGKYMQSVGLSEAFVLPHRMHRKAERPVPHFFTTQELTAFFLACDTLKACGSARVRQLVLPVFFRLLYCCGLRTCEARTLRVEDVDLQRGQIEIVGSKGHRSRRLPIPTDLLALFRSYEARVCEIYPNRCYFFPTTQYRCYTRSSIGTVFQQIWKAAGLQRSCTPRARAYDFRHHFAFANLNRWITAGREVGAMLPYLSRYMGHACLESTDYYLHLVPEFFPTFSRTVRATETLLPEVDDEQE
jgi:integrase/recombinase XerD